MQRVGGDVQLGHLGLVAVGDEAALEPFAGTGDRRHRAGQQAARAGLRGAEHPAVAPHRVAQPLGQADGRGLSQLRGRQIRPQSHFLLLAHPKTPVRATSAITSKA
ncbi:hypothetical protein D3C71_1866500 [compost metagenome]